MSSASTQPKWGPDRPCRDCTHFGHWVGGDGIHAWCLHGKYVHAMPQRGCAYWRSWIMSAVNAEEPETEKPPAP